MKLNHAALAIASSLVVVAVLSGCGAAQKSASYAPIGSPPSTIDEAQKEIDDARLAITGEPRRGQDGAPAATSPPEAQTESLASSSSSPSAAREASVCEAPCRAIASMRRAVVALCRLTGEADARCSAARSTLADTEAKVARSSCGC